MARNSILLISLTLVLIHQVTSEYCYCREGKEGEDDYLECEFFGRDQPIEGISLIHLKHNTTIAVLRKGLILPFKSLKTLYVTAANIERIEPGALDGIQLEMIDFYHNKLRTIENGTFDALKTLKTLDISFNNLESLEAHTFSGLTSLEWLSLNSNSLKTINKSAFGRLKKLKALHLRLNKIETLEWETFQNLTFLEMLDLSFNSLKSLPVGLFGNLKSLQTMELTHNYLERFPNILFENNTALHTLDVSENKIVEFPEDFFKPLVELEIFRFHMNHVAKLNTTVLLRNSPKLKEVYLHYNQWECDNLKKMLSDFQVHSVFVATGTAVLEFNVNGIGCYRATV